MEKSLKKSYSQIDWTLIFMWASVIIFYILVHDLVGGTLFEHNAWDSYTLQAYRWLQGEVGLGQNYEYLELAIYKNDWFVSFPPVPSVCMLPWVVIYGLETPNNIIMIFYVLITMTLVYKCARQFEYSDTTSAFWSVVIVIGSNMTWMSTMGGVWFQAQLLNMLFCMATLYCMLKNKRVFAYAFLALAVGCRPFSVCYYLPMFVYFYKIDKENIGEDNKSKENNIEDDTKKQSLCFIKIALKQFKAVLIPILIAGGYMAYNYVRFDSLFEFGHNYLPEFTESEYGQFNTVYLVDNLKNLFVRGINIKGNGQLELEVFNGFWMYVANPIFIIWFVYFFRNIFKRKNIFLKKIDMVKITIVIAMVLNIIFICLHKTLGGWQFGARYMVDLIPFTLLYIFLSKKDAKIHRWEVFIGSIAVMFNVYGIFYMKR